VPELLLHDVEPFALHPEKPVSELGSTYSREFATA
jgi:hypothetical protein